MFKYRAFLALSCVGALAATACSDESTRASGPAAPFGASASGIARDEAARDEDHGGWEAACETAEDGLTTCSFEDRHGTVCSATFDADEAFVSQQCSGEWGSYGCERALDESIGCTVYDAAGAVVCAESYSAAGELQESSCAFERPGEGGGRGEGEEGEGRRGGGHGGGGYGDDEGDEYGEGGGCGGGGRGDQDEDGEDFGGHEHGERGGDCVVAEDSRVCTHERPDGVVCTESWTPEAQSVECIDPTTGDVLSSAACAIDAEGLLACSYTWGEESCAEVIDLEQQVIISSTCQP